MLITTDPYRMATMDSIQEAKTNNAINVNTPKNSKPEYSGVCIHIVGVNENGARQIMTYQNRTIHSCILDNLRRKGISIAEPNQLDEMIGEKIGRLNAGQNIAVEVDPFGVVLSLHKISGFDCLYDVNESAVIISFQELERFFYEQQTISI